MCYHFPIFTILNYYCILITDKAKRNLNKRNQNKFHTKNTKNEIEEQSDEKKNKKIAFFIS